MTKKTQEREQAIQDVTKSVIEILWGMTMEEKKREYEYEDSNRIFHDKFYPIDLSRLLSALEKKGYRYMFKPRWFLQVTKNKDYFINVVEIDWIMLLENNQTATLHDQTTESLLKVRDLFIKK